MKICFLKHSLFFVSILLAGGCSNTNMEDLTDPIAADLITYTEHVQPIIANNCVHCHADPPVNGAPIRLTTYEAVKEATQNRGLLDRVQRQEGEPGAMPLGGPRLPQELIDVMLRWEIDGLAE